ncbi:MAG TPA: LysR family transcriptional regulator [Bryobacteraceae bacterium]|nr:LysR family transcriptional regulator [Bryobacteraceae bacterium]
METLRLYRDIATSRSFSQGAAQNGVSQSFASQQIRQLERSLGIALLDRSTRPLSVTSAGKLYLELCRDVLRRDEEFRAALDQLKAEVDGTVRVAAIYSVGLSEMSELEREFSRRYPGATLEVEYLRPEKVYDAVVEDRADLGLMSYAEPTREVTVLPWRDEEMVVAVAPNHPLARWTGIDPHELEGQDFVGFDDDLPIRRDVDRYLREHGVSVDVTVHFDNLQTMKQAVALGAGVSIMPARVMRDEIAQGRLLPVRLIPATLFRPVRIVHRKRKRFNRATEAFLELLQAPIPADAWAPVPAA